MARLRAVCIYNFRGLVSFEWVPSPGMNCLIGPGDSGKSTVLDAIDLCIGTRRNAVFSDADFHALDTSRPISIYVTLGDLPEGLRSMEAYGAFLRGFDARSNVVVDEPGSDHETALTLLLTVGADLEPVWSLYSKRAAAQGLVRGLAWPDRQALSPTRIGGSGYAHLGWKRGSVLRRLSDESPDATAALVAASRQARETFGTEAEEQLTSTLAIVDRVASALGVPVSGRAHAYLDAQSISFSGGTVSLHDGQGVPLTALGTGSSRLLVAGLQREAAPQANIVLVDELEHGLEPHRLIGLLGSLGAKDRNQPLQVFCTTHSPVAVRELAAAQLCLLRKATDGRHVAARVSEVGDFQGVLRVFPEAFLATKVIVCEGASEVGFLRGVDHCLTREGGPLTRSMAARGVALIDAGGASKLYDRANAFLKLGFATAAFRDDDVQPTPQLETDFLAGGGKLVKWRLGRALEDELFASLPDAAVLALVDLAVELHGEALVEAHIRTASANALSLADRAALVSPSNRPLLAAAANSRAAWFKTVSHMERLGADIVGPHLNSSDPDFVNLLGELYIWMKA